MPDAVIAQVKHVPPLIELLGEAERSVPLTKGEELVRIAKAVGAQAGQALILVGSTASISRIPTR